ncbi:ATP-binding protein, partial [Rhodococcus qingshengii]|uniref:ATP-binding protein n=1 Tax=Rhodococcus qingshengii TaxID=334542 RepID=UPI0002B7C58F
MTSSAWAIGSPAAASPSLSVSATPEQLPVLRSLVRTVAAHYALSLDGLSDAVLAVDEAATILIGHALPS